MGSISASMIAEVLSKDESSARFENYCVELLSRVEQTTIVSTSKSWDLGRDGRSIGIEGIYVCATLRSDVDTKSLADIKRLASRTSPQRVYFCTAQKLSEHAGENLKARIKHKTGLTVTPLSGPQLAEMDVHTAPTPDALVFKAHYGAELETLIRLLSPGPSGTDSGLRLALMAMGGESSSEIRLNTFKTLVFDCFRTAPATPLSLNTLAIALGNRARTSKPLAVPSLLANMRLLTDEGVVRRLEDGAFELTPKGHQELATTSSNLATNLLAGKEAIRKSLEELLGRGLPSDMFQDIWNAVEEKLATLLYTRGSQILAATSAFLNEAEAPESIQDYVDVVQSVADAAATAWHDDTSREEIRTAVKDLLEEGTGSAADWLLQVFCTYLSICSLGLESSASNALRSILSKTEIVLDTDVVLSLLCEGENNHADVTEAFKQWRSIGGGLLLAEPVLAEATHHAFIAEDDFRAVEKWLPGSFIEARRLVRNAFVRAFAELLRRKKVQKSDWRRYIGQFRGANEKDTELLRAVLEGEFKLEYMPASKPGEHSAGKRLLEEAQAQIGNDAVREALDAHERKIRIDKATKDAALVSAIALRRVGLSRGGSEGTCCLVSSSQRLRDIPGWLHEAESVIPWVVSPATWLHLLTLLPGVSIGLAAMRALLFDGSFRRRLPEMDELLLRSVKEAGRLHFGWSRRATLIANVQTALFKMAKALGVPKKDVIEVVRHPQASESGAQVAATVIAEALDAMAVETPEERALKKRVEELERQNQLLREERLKRGR